MEAAVQPKPLRRRDPDRPWYSYAARLLPDGPLGRWADFGCGRGEFIEQASGDAKSGIGVDYSVTSARALRATGRPALVADLNHGLPFASGALDGASMIEVIEHIVQAEALVAELARVIRPGGWLIVTTPERGPHRLPLARADRSPAQAGGLPLPLLHPRHARGDVRGGRVPVVAQASFGKQAILSKLARMAGKGAKHKVRYVVPRPFEPLFAQHFVWRLERVAK